MFGGTSWIRVAMLPKVGGTLAGMKLEIELVIGADCCTIYRSAARISF